QFGVASAAGGLAGAALQPVLGSPALAKVLAVLLLVAGASELARKRVPLPATPAWRLAGGGLSGLLGGLVGNQGGMRAAALMGFRLPPRQLVATATASALVVDAARVPIYLVSAGPAIAGSVPHWLAACAGVTLGTYWGVPLLKRIPASIYQRVVGALLVVLGLSLFLAAA
ncbi:MAG: TSUP family transporter, partial [Gemmataceae bacterium]|nr:TSUP family transporter [Gemmataceae bacterium]